MEDKLARLAAAGIQVLPAPGISNHFFLERNGFVALVRRAGEGFGQAGGAGLLTEHGFAVLVWRGEEPYLVARGHEQRANSEQVEQLRLFDADVHAALSGTLP